MLQQPCVRSVTDRHGGQRDIAVYAVTDHVREIASLTHAVCQQHDMFDRSLTPGEHCDCLLQCRLDRRAAAVADLPDRVLDRGFVIRQPKRHLPVILVIKSQNAHIIRVVQIINGNLRRPDSDVQIADAVIPLTARHTAGAVDHHDHRHRRHLVHAPKLHVHRQHCLQHRITVAPQRKAVLAAAADEPAAVILHICLQIVQKLLRQIVNIRVHQYDRLVIQHIVDADRRIPRGDYIVIAARRAQHSGEMGCADITP